MKPDHEPRAANARSPLPEPAVGPRSQSLHVCVLCSGTLVHPFAWAPEGAGHWWVQMRCPECEAIREGLFSQGSVDRFADELDRGSGILISALDRLTRENMQAELDVLVQALARDLIVPSDF